MSIKEKQPYNISFFSLIISVFFINLIYFVVFSGMTFQSEKLLSVVYGCLHLLVATALEIWIWMKITSLAKREKISLVNFLFVILVLYYVLSVPKYFVDELYVGFVENLHIRFLGSFIVGMTIAFAAKIHFSGMDKKKYYSYQEVFYKIKIPWWLLFAITLINVGNLVVFLSEGAISPYLLSDISQIPQIILESSWVNTLTATLSSLMKIAIFVLFGVYLAREKTLASIFIVGVNVLVLLVHSVLVGSRGMLLIPLFIMFAVGALKQKEGWQRFLKIASLAPVAIVILSLAAFSFSGRTTIEKATIMRQFAYRFDFADFPMTILEKQGLFFFGNSIISDAVVMSIPRIFAPNKIRIPLEGQYVEMASLINPAQPYMDYTDSYFSMGASAFGILGFVGLLPLVIMFLNYLESKVLVFWKFGALFLVLSLKIFFWPEFTWINFFATLRTTLILNIPAAFLLYLFLWRRKQNGNFNIKSIQ